MFVEEQQIHQVRQATSIVDLIAQQVRLQPKGKEMVGLCPFHEDRNPSMYVSPAKQIYHCFTCGAGGDAYGWMINFHKMGFPEAVRFLADRAGITLDTVRSQDAAGVQPTDRQQLADANAKALAFFRGILADKVQGRKARDYQTQRGISAEMAEHFGLGSAPDRWDGLVQTIASNRWSVKAFRAAGLIAARTQGGGDFDRLRHRLIFPIYDGLGRPIAFGGRMLADGTLGDRNEAKYLNSPETALFNKSATLYGLHLAKKSIIDGTVAVVVEGYTDVIACHQHGLTNVVATLGTSLTSQHVNLLRRFAEKVVLVFDGDEAGQKAADRALEIFFSGSMDVAVAILPDGQDPAELLGRSDGVQTLRCKIEGAVDALDYQFERVSARFDAAQTVAGRMNVAETYIGQLAEMGLARQGAIRRSMIVQKLADLLGLKRDEVSRLIDRSSSRPARPQNSDQTQAGKERSDITSESEKKPDIGIASSESRPRINALRMAEMQLIGGLLVQPDLYQQALTDGQTLDRTLTASQMLSDPAKRVFEMIGSHIRDGQPMSLASLLSELAWQGQVSLGDWVRRAESDVDRMTNGDEGRLRQVVHGAVEAILSFHRDQKYRQVAAAARPSGQSDGEDQMLRQIEEHQRAHPSAARIARLGT